MTTETFKCYKNSTLFDAQNDGYQFLSSRFKNLLGGMHPDPQRGKGPCSQCL